MRSTNCSTAMFLCAVFVSITLGITPAAGQTYVTGGGGGAYFKFAVPSNWNGDLIIWNNGLNELPIAPFIVNPAAPLTSLGPPPQGVFSLAQRQFSEGFALATTTRRETGWAVFQSNNDLHNMMDNFIPQFGVPNRIFLTGRSFGALVAIQAIETGHLGNVVGGLSMCGTSAGSRNWDLALDLRLTYDAVCSQVAPLPGGAEGLPENSTLTTQQIAGAINQCSGVLLPPSARTAAQQSRLSTIVNTARIPESFLLTDMIYATLIMSDLVHDKLNGKIGTENLTVDYGDTAINKAIARISANPGAQNRLEDNYTPDGKVNQTRIVALHTDKDGLAVVENETDYSSKAPAASLSTAIAIEAAPSHCGFTPAEITAGWESLRDWVDGSAQPTATSIKDKCQQVSAQVGGACRFDPAFVLPALENRIRPR